MIEYLENQLELQYKSLKEEIILGYKLKRKTTFRINTLKISIEEGLNKLSSLGINFEKIAGFDNAYSTDDNLGGNELFLNGEIYLQSLSSMIPPIILNPIGKKDILDMCAAPGSKTCQLAGIINNNGFITACEVNKIRMDKLKYNCEKQGAKCVNFMLVDSCKLDDFFRFDSILLDAPCSGSGTLLESDKSFSKFSKELVNNSSVLQTKLLAKALTILKPGCEMVYSTCSILSKENEEVLNKVLKRFNCEIVPLEKKEYGHIEYLPTSIDGVLCIKPNEYYEGFFVAKIKKR